MKTDIAVYAKILLYLIYIHIEIVTFEYYSALNRVTQ